MVEVDISPIRRLAQHARVHPDRAALVYEDRAVGFAELHDQAGSLATALASNGIGPGDRVAYFGLNSVSLVVSYLACSWIGAVFVPVNFRLAAAEVVALLKDARPDTLIAEPSHAGTLDPHLDELGIRLLVAIDNDLAAGSAPPLRPEWIPLGDFVSPSVTRQPPVERRMDDLAALLYTSGTTGRPKGVMMSHGNIWWNQVNVDAVVDSRADDVYLLLSPMFHIGGLNSFLLGGIARGATTVIRRTVDPEQILRDLVDFRITGLFAVPAILSAVVRLPGFADADLSALRSAVVGGAPVPPAMITAFSRKGVSLQQSWGMTETASFGTYLEASKTHAKLGSAGLPMPFTELQIVDLALGTPTAGPEQPGEIWVRGPNIVSGYWNNPEATATAFPGDGWFRTGDIGYLDDEGYVYLVDRLKDMIISGGENIYPAEVERVLAAHPAVTDVGVVGAAHDRWGETVVAVVSLSAEAQLTLDELRDFAAASLARYKLPTRMLVVESVPRNGSGKLEKKLIRELVAGSIDEL